MNPNSPSQPAFRSHGRARPGQDIIVAKKAANFPSVGMALPSYQNQSRERPRRAVPAPAKVGRWRRLRRKVTLKRAVLTVFILMMAVGGFLAFKFVYNAHKLFGGSIFNVLKSTKLKGEDVGRVNILLAGNSADDAGHNGAQLTDSIMLVSIDTKNNKAFMLSIPRDLWVHIPGDGHDKINDAYVVGENNNFSSAGYPDGGMGMLEKVVSQDLGIPINYYALIDYSAFKQSVDAVGGIDVTIKSDDPRGLYDPNIDWTTHGPLVRLSNGPHHLNGQQALDLARARGDAYNSYGFAGSDFTRTADQRMMLVALKAKAASAGVIANPAKLSGLFDAVGNNVKTDMKLDEVHRLYDLTKKIDGNSIQSLSLNSADGKNLLQSYTSSNGQSALIPAAGVDDYSDVQNFIKRHTSNNPVIQEGAKIVVLNGTVSNGLALKWQRKLTASGFYVAAVGDAQTSSQAITSIIDNTVGPNGKSGKPATQGALIQQFGNHVTTQNPYANIYDADFVIVLGQDQAASSSSGTAPTSTSQ